MMERIHFEVPGKPIALKRHRTITRAKGGRALPFARNYDPSKHDKDDFLLLCVDHCPATPIKGPISLAVIFWMPALESFRKDQKKVVEWIDYDYKKKSLTPIGAIPTILSKIDYVPANLVFHVKRPDCDNLMKLVMDAMDRSFWADDSQVQIMAVKLYSNRPRTEVEILYAPQE